MITVQSAPGLVFLAVDGTVIEFPIAKAAEVGSMLLAASKAAPGSYVPDLLAKRIRSL